jgi:hypothetical protein
MYSKLKQLIKRTPIFRLYAFYKKCVTGHHDLILRASSPRCDRYPYHDVIEEQARSIGANILIETGTHIGNTSLLFKDLFSEIHTIELSERLYKLAKTRLSDYPHIVPYHGASESLLPQIASTVKKPCIFWLDAHYSGGVTALGRTQTPIEQELRLIYLHFRIESAILIDDAKDFDGNNGYPTLRNLEKLVGQLSQGRSSFELDRGVVVIRNRYC